MSTTENIAQETSSRVGWNIVPGREQGSLHARMVSSGFIMLIGSVFVSILSFAYNVAVARLLGPAEFSHAAAAVTLLMLVSCINLAFQMVTAKLIAQKELPSERAGIYQTLRRRAWGIGLGVGGTLGLASVPLSNYLRLPSPLFMIVLAVGFVFYIPLGVKRGGMQGTCKFHRLAGSLSSEALIKLLSAVLLVWLGFGVFGAVLGIAASVILAFFLPSDDHELMVNPQPHTPAHFREGLQAITFFVGQVIINNVDILLVKHFFPADQAGLYAAIALVGRLLYFATWSVTSAMFPLSAGERQEKGSRNVLAISLLFVVVLSGIFITVLEFCPTFIVRTLFGAGFSMVNNNLKSLLTMNAIAMAVYAITVVLITYEMSRRIANTAWLQLVVSGLVIAGVTAFHSSLMEVIVVQQVLRVLLLLAVSAPFLRFQRAYAEEAS